MLIDRADSMLLVVDVQERLAPAVAGRERAVANIAILMRAAARLAVPVVVTEHYPDGLGRTVAELAALTPDEAKLEKIHFSIANEPRCMERLAAARCRQVVIAGMEAHVCVLQSAIGLSGRGYRPVVVRDATASRTQENHEAAMARMEAQGIVIATTEMVLFEWLGRGGTEDFRTLLPLIR